MTLLRLDASILPRTSASAELADLLEAEWSAPAPASRSSAVTLAPTRCRPMRGCSRPLPVPRPKASAPRPSATPSPWPSIYGGADQGGCRPVGGPAVQLRRLPAFQDVDRPGHGRSRTVRHRPAEGQARRAGHRSRGRLRTRHPREGWDHSTPYLRRILGDLWQADVTVIERELTLAATTPGMEGLKALATQLHTEALRHRTPNPGAPYAAT